MEIAPFDNREGFIWMNGEFIKWNDAKCHVITSKYEGFGITAVEAYNFNCPVIQNNNSSLNEVGYNHASTV